VVVLKISNERFASHVAFVDEGGPNNYVVCQMNPLPAGPVCTTTTGAKTLIQRQTPELIEGHFCSVECFDELRFIRRKGFQLIRKRVLITCSRWPAGLSLNLGLGRLEPPVTLATTEISIVGLTSPQPQPNHKIHYAKGRNRKQCLENLRHQGQHLD
jgi:hypothetical protein